MVIRGTLLVTSQWDDSSVPRDIVWGLLCSGFRLVSQLSAHDGLSLPGLSPCDQGSHSVVYLELPTAKEGGRLPDSLSL